MGDPSAVPPRRQGLDISILQTCQVILRACSCEDSTASDENRQRPGSWVPAQEPSWQDPGGAWQSAGVEQGDLFHGAGLLEGTDISRSTDVDITRSSGQHG